MSNRTSLVALLLGLATAAASCSGDLQEPGEQTIDTVLSGQQMYISGFGQRTQVRLPDSTMVMLNSGSRLALDSGFGQTTRSVRLSGDALFTIAADKRPFRIRTPHLVLTTAGAVMRVNGYDHLAGEETLVLSGTVHAVKSYYSSLDHEPYDLQGGEMVMMNKDIDLMEKETFDTTELSSWIAGRLEFRASSFQQVINTLKAWYNIEIRVSGDVPPDLSFSGSFVRPSLRQVLLALSKQGKFRFKAGKDPVEINF